LYPDLIKNQPVLKVFDQIKADFIKNVLQKSETTKLTSKTKLINFCEDKRFEKEFKEMFLNRTQLFFGVSILKMYDDPILDIIQYLRDIKMKKLANNWL
jgi:hypothetical protein